MQNLKFSFEKLQKKNRRMRILGARIFSKFFGGKIWQNWTAVNYNKREPKIKTFKLRKHLLILSKR